MRGGKLWISNCACGATLTNKGSGRPRTKCDSCKTVKQLQRSAKRQALDAQWKQQRASRKVRQSIKRKTHLHWTRSLVLEEKLRRGKCEWPDGCPLPLVTVDNYHAFDFDHRNPHDKRFSLSKIRNQSVKQVLEEMAKCDLLCAFHHRIRTQRDRHQHLSKDKAEELRLFE